MKKASKEEEEGMRFEANRKLQILINKNPQYEVIAGTFIKNPMDSSPLIIDRGCFQKDSIQKTLLKISKKKDKNLLPF